MMTDDYGDTTATTLDTNFVAMVNGDVTAMTLDMSFK
jgi:hypothetical protein